MPLLTFEKVGDSYQVIAWNRKIAGHIEMAEDGYQVFWPCTGDGFWEAHYLREIADKLDELNKEWDWVVQNDPSIPRLPCENCGHTSFSITEEKDGFDCNHCGSRWEIDDAPAN